MPRSKTSVLKRFQEKGIQGAPFEPASQEQSDLITSTCRETLGDGGFGSGKTVGGIMRLLLLAEKYPGSRWFVGRQLYKDLSQTTRKTFERICPLGWVKRDVLNETTMFNGSEIVWAHLDEYDLKTLMGLEINGAFLDQVEEISPDMYEALDSRIGRWYLPEWGKPCPAYIWATSNPAGKDWVYFRFHPDCAPPPYRKYIFMPTKINKEVLDKYHPGYYENLMRKSPSWRRRWVEAQRDTFEGQIFGEFNHKLHLYDPDRFNPYSSFAQGAAWAFMDYGLTHPTTLLITWTTQEYCFITAEFGEAEKKISENAASIKALVGRNPVKVRGIFGDPSMFHESTRDRSTATTSVANEYRKEGVYLLKADNNEESSIEILHELFNVRMDKKPIDNWRKGAPTLYINENCVNLIREIEMQRWKEARNPLTGEKEFIGVRLESVADDYFDCVRYYANSKIHQVSITRPKMRLPSYGWEQKAANPLGLR